MSHGSMTRLRWFIGEYRTGDRAKNQPVDGFAARDDALAWHRDHMGGDMRYVFAEERG
jgi:hypothetical protein